jgi:hypothetical protein
MSDRDKFTADRTEFPLAERAVHIAPADPIARADDEQRDDFAAAASEPRENVLAEFWQFLRHNKKWWLLPIVLVLLLFGVLVILSGTGAAPFIYTLF